VGGSSRRAAASGDGAPLIPAQSRVDRRARGEAAERRAAEYLVAKGLTILDRNFRCRFGELDLVALTPEGVLVIVEVRMRSASAWGDGSTSVDIHKQRRLTLAARVLLAARPRLARRAVRFDVVTIDSGGELRWIRQAFDAR
jgi:putative endonuclease